MCIALTRIAVDPDPRAARRLLVKYLIKRKPKAPAPEVRKLKFGLN